MIHAFEFRNRFYALDVESGAVFGVDKQAFDVIGAIQNGVSPYALPYPEQEIKEIITEFEELAMQGAFDSNEQTVPQGAAGGVIKAMCMHMAHDCNLRCKYCFADTGGFHGDRMLMPLNVAKASLDFLIKNSGNRKNLEVDLFGGEPLLNWDVVKQTVAYGRELEAKHNKVIRFTITTNGVALDDEKIDYINKEMHNVVLSIDGRKDIHDALRPTVNGKGSYDIITDKALKLVQKRGEKEYYVRGTFTRNNLDFTKDVIALRDLGFDQISLEPVVLQNESPYSILKEHTEKVLAEYDKLADEVISSRKQGKWFNFFHFMVDFTEGPCLKKRVSGCGAGAEYVAVSPEGDVYPCHQFVGEKDFLMGNVQTGELDKTIQETFAACNILTKPECRNCWCKYYCSGGCAANAQKYNGDIYKPYAITCEFQKKRTECAIGIYAEENAENEE